MWTVLILKASQATPDRENICFFRLQSKVCCKATPETAGVTQRTRTQRRRIERKPNNLQIKKLLLVIHVFLQVVEMSTMIIKEVHTAMLYVNKISDIKSS